MLMQLEYTPLTAVGSSRLKLSHGKSRVSLIRRVYMTFSSIDFPSSFLLILPRSRDVTDCPPKLALLVFKPASCRYGWTRSAALFTEPEVKLTTLVPSTDTR